MDYAIQTFGLTKVFADLWGRAKVRAVTDLNLQVLYNEVFGLLGPNGSGKTTTLKMLLGLLHPTRGRAVVLGGDSTDPKISARIGFMPEESYLYRYLTARETLDFYGRLFGLPGRVRRRRIEALLDMVGLNAVGNRPVGTFSKGMARRIGLAQALINDPELLILDEPTTGLDPIGTRQIKDLILELARRGKTVLLCSHLLADVEDVCDRIAIMYGGKIQTAGQVRELLTQTGKMQIITDRLSDSAIERIRQIAESEQASLEVTAPMEKLENFFIKTITEAEETVPLTAGVVSTGRISEFLKSGQTTESILDKLVAEPVSPGRADAADEVEPEAAAATQPGPVAEADQADAGLLEDLTQTSPPAETTPVEDNRRSAQPDKTGQQDRQRDILEELTGPEPGTADEDKPSPQHGEHRDA